jgi:SAM-dependent methyltransferase
MTTETLTCCALCRSEDTHTIDPVASIDECGSCGYAFANPRPVVEDIAAYYSRPSKYDRWLDQEHGFDRLARWRLAQIRTRGGDLLDVGAGIGQFLAHAKKDFNSVQGTEISRSAIEIARVMYGINLIHGEIECLDIPAKSFDVITLFHVLEHVPNPRTTVETCHRLLRKGGVLVIAVPNDRRSLRQRSKRLLVKLRVPRFRNAGPLALPRVRLDGSVDEIHLSHFTPGALERLLAATGFENQQSSLDRWYCSTGWLKARQDVFYGISLGTWKALAINLYDTIWVQAVRGTAG